MIDNKLIMRSAGETTVLCAETTGILTIDKIGVRTTTSINQDNLHLAEITGMSCLADTSDRIERALLSFCEGLNMTPEFLFSGNLIKSYNPTETLHIGGYAWEKNGRVVTAIKGDPEQILSICNMENIQRTAARERISFLLHQGLIVIAVADMLSLNFDILPETLDTSTQPFELCGMIGLCDPLRENISEDISRCDKENVRIILFTQENIGICGETNSNNMSRLMTKLLYPTSHSQLQQPDTNTVLNSAEICSMSDEKLCQQLKYVSVISGAITVTDRQRILEALCKNGENVASTWDDKESSNTLFLSGKLPDILEKITMSREENALKKLEDERTESSSLIDSTQIEARKKEDKKMLRHLIKIYIPPFIALLLLLLSLLFNRQN